MEATLNALSVIAALLVVFAALACYGKWRLHSLSNPEKKVLLKETINGVFTWFEDRGLLSRTPSFNRDYLRDYPALKVLEANVDAVREECVALLTVKHKLTSMQEMGGFYTRQGVHGGGWTTFMFKLGKFVEPNCELCPKTADLLRQLPGLHTAFFSVLEAHQHLAPHWGYYKGFQRYHLGILIPGDNAERECFLRVNSDPHDNSLQDPSLVEKGEKYYWRNGEGIVFDDNYLHDAANQSDELRVVLWLDLRRKMPFYLQAFNILWLAIVQRDPSIRRMRRRAVIER